MNIKLNKSKIPIILTSAFIIITFFILTLLTPYIGDDWTWGQNEYVKNSFDVGFQDLNGRYAGHLVAIALTHVRLLKLIVIPICVFLICFFVYKFSNSNHFSILSFSFLLILITPLPIWRQVFTWSAGFANYVTSSLISLVLIFMFSNVLNKQEPSYPKYFTYISPILGIIGALFAENITLFNIALALLIIIISKVKHKKIHPAQIALLIGTILGALLMFTNKIYLDIFTGNDGYRQISNSGSSIIYQFCVNLHSIIEDLFFSNRIFWICISVIQTLILIHFLIKNKKFCWLIPFNIINLLFILLPYFIDINLKLELLILIFYFFTHFTISFFIIPKNSKLYQPLLLAVLMFLPLIIVSPVGSRNFFSMYVMLMIFAVKLFDYFINNCFNTKILRYITHPIISLVSILIIVNLIIIFAHIHKVDVARTKFAKQQYEDGQQVIITCYLPHQSFIHRDLDDNNYWAQQYSLFIGLPKETQYSFVEYKDLKSAINNYNQSQKE